MTKDLTTVDEEADLSICAKLMLERGISSLIVTGSKDGL